MTDKLTKNSPTRLDPKTKLKLKREAIQDLSVAGAGQVKGGVSRTRIVGGDERAAC